MKSLVFACLLALTFTAGLGAQESADPYSMAVVRMALRLRSGGKQVILSSTQKNLARLGDAVSIAVLKLFNKEDLTNPQVVRDFLPIIHDAFSQTQLITNEVDRQPKVTLFLLTNIRAGVPDAQIQRDIDETIQFVTAASGKIADGLDERR